MGVVVIIEHGEVTSLESEHAEQVVIKQLAVFVQYEQRGPSACLGRCQQVGIGERLLEIFLAYGLVVLIQ